LSIKDVTRRSNSPEPDILHLLPLSVEMKMPEFVPKRRDEVVPKKQYTGGGGPIFTKETEADHPVMPSE